jgi:N6-L-threonylcarbamoyladenine synthase
MYFLGIETSCDETAAAVFTDAPAVLASVIASQTDLHARFGGVVPEVAARAHLQRLLPVIDDALRQAGVRLDEIGCVAVHNTPGLVGALLVGVSAAKMLAVALGVPLVAVNHVEGHVYACRLAAGRDIFPCVGLVVSGGHTSLFHCRSPLNFELLGATLDDAAGEAFDKVAALLGLGFPGGPAVEREAAAGDPRAVKLPRSFLHDERLDFSFSGLKTAVLTAVRRATNLCDQVRADVALAFVDAAVDVLTAKSLKALRQCGHTRLVVSGGVSANSQLRARLTSEAALIGAQVYFPPPDLCTDNGAMIALAGWASLERGVTPGPIPAIQVRPRWPLESIG